MVNGGIQIHSAKTQRGGALLRILAARWAKERENIYERKMEDGKWRYMLLQIITFT